MARVVFVGTPATSAPDRFFSAAGSAGVEAIWLTETPDPPELPDTCVGLVRADDADPVDAARAFTEWATADSQIEAVIPLREGAALTAAFVSATLDKPGNLPAAVARTQSRSAARRAWFDAGIPHAEFRSIGPGDDLAHLARLVGTPCAVISDTRQGRRRIAVAQTADDLAEGMASLGSYASSVAANGGLLLERQVGGATVLAIGVLGGDSWSPWATVEIVDRTGDPLGDEEYVVPARLDREQRREVERVAPAAARALGLESGLVGVELAVRERFVRASEVYAGALPDEIMGPLDRLTDSLLTELIVESALDSPAVPFHGHGAAGALCIARPSAGIVHIGGTAEAEAVAGVTKVRIAEPPSAVQPRPYDTICLAEIHARAESPDSVLEALEQARQKIVLDVE